MMNNRLLGALGEQEAARLLRAKGYDIISGNYKTRAGEIDIVAENKKYICFVEVKTRKTGGFTAPADAVDFHKQSNIKNCAAAYLTEYKTKKTVRYDIIEVFVENDKPMKINHIENAF